MSYEAEITQLQQFRSLLTEYDRGVTGERRDYVRQQLNQRKQSIKALMVQTRVHRTYAIHPAPMVGGPIYSSADPLSYMFDRPYGESLNHYLTDMIDEAIGVFKSGQLPELPGTQATVSESHREGYAFIAMAIDSTDPHLIDVLDAIKSAAADCGIIAERIDEQITNERITDRILEAIRSAEFIVVDLTHSKPNVFYEAGFAQGLGKTPVYLSRSGTKPEFDIKDYPIIFFDNMRSLRDQLKARLEALVSRRKSALSQ